MPVVGRENHDTHSSAMVCYSSKNGSIGIEGIGDVACLVERHGEEGTDGVSSSNYCSGRCKVSSKVV